jgi:3-isopropylmalate dehydrogenase
MMLDQLGESAAARAVEAAILKVTPIMPSQAAGKMGATTSQIGDRIAAAV